MIAEYEGSISVEVSGNKLSELDWLAGAHSVQRVPPTESRGRRHTSLVTISISPVYEIKTEIREADIEISTMRGTGPGGQAVNKTESTVRVVHKPTKISVRINGPDQHGNKQKALQILKSRVFELADQQIRAEAADKKFAQTGLNNRGGKAFTWNYIDSFVKNHSNGKVSRNIRDIERGDFSSIK